MKLALILTAALAGPTQHADLPSLEHGEAGRCIAPEGCVMLTKNAMRQVIVEIGHQAALACVNSKKEWL